MKEFGEYVKSYSFENEEDARDGKEVELVIVTMEDRELRFLCNDQGYKLLNPREGERETYEIPEQFLNALTPYYQTKFMEKLANKINLAFS